MKCISSNKIWFIKTSESADGIDSCMKVADRVSFKLKLSTSNHNTTSNFLFQTNKMKTFDLLRNYIRNLGIFQWSSNRCGNLFTTFLNCVYFGIFMIFFMTTLWYFLFTAQTIIEYAKSFYFMSYAIVVLVWYSTFLWKTDEYAALFKNFDIKVRKSK